MRRDHAGDEHSEKVTYSFDGLYSKTEKRNEVDVKNILGSIRIVP